MKPRFVASAPAVLVFALVHARTANAAESAPKADTPRATPPSAASPDREAAPDPSAGGADARSSSSVRLTYEATHVDRAAPAARERDIDDAMLLHGFRLGYGYVASYDAPAEAFRGESLKERAGLRSPHHFLLGYEIVYRIVGHSWLNVLVLGNAMVAGLEQSRVMPSGNLLLGFEIKSSFQMGVGANLSPLKGSEAHAIVAAGWTPRVGTIYTPVHAFFIPDVDGYHRIGVTTGVTF